MAKIDHRIKTALTKYIKDVDELLPINKAILFGSYAKGTQSQNSDIDIAIFSENVNDDNRLEIMSSLILLVTKYKIDIQPFVFSYKDYTMEESELIATEIKKKGIELFSKN